MHDLLNNFHLSISADGTIPDHSLLMWEISFHDKHNSNQDTISNHLRVLHKVRPNMKPLPENYMKKEIVKTKLNALLYNLPAYHIDTSYIKFKSIIQDEVGLDKSNVHRKHRLHGGIQC